MNGKQLYKDSQNMDDRDELLSTTDVDISSSDEAKDWSLMKSRSARRSKGRGLVAVLRDYRWLITTSMLGVTIVLQLIIWREVSGLSVDNKPQVGGDYTAKGPTCSQKPPAPHPKTRSGCFKPLQQITDIT